MIREKMWLLLNDLQGYEHRNNSNFYYPLSWVPTTNSLGNCCNFLFFNVFFKYNHGRNIFHTIFYFHPIIHTKASIMKIEIVISRIFKLNYKFCSQFCFVLLHFIVSNTKGFKFQNSVLSSRTVLSDFFFIISNLVWRGSQRQECWPRETCLNFS